MTTIQDLQVTDADKINIDILRGTAELFKDKRTGDVRRAVFKCVDSRQLSVLEIQHSNFVVMFCMTEESSRREWRPSKDYDKNYFCTYWFNGTAEEFDRKDNSLVKLVEGEQVINTSIVLDYPTYEVYTKASWLCISSWGPYTATYQYIDGAITIPSNTGVYVVLGRINDGMTDVAALEYLTPKQTEFTITGQAKILLFNRDKFTNIPSD
jgi:hypothetical protein